MCSMVPQWPPNSLWGLYQCRSCTRDLELTEIGTVPLLGVFTLFTNKIGMYCLKKSPKPPKNKKRFVLSSLLMFQNFSSVLPSHLAWVQYRCSTHCAMWMHQKESEQERGRGSRQTSPTLALVVVEHLAQISSAISGGTWRIQFSTLATAWYF